MSGRQTLATQFKDPRPLRSCESSWPVASLSFCFPLRPARKMGLTLAAVLAQLTLMPPSSWAMVRPQYVKVPS